MERPGLSSVIKLFSEALCATRSKNNYRKKIMSLKKKKVELTGYETDPFIYNIYYMLYKRVGQT